MKSPLLFTFLTAAMSLTVACTEPAEPAPSLDAERAVDLLALIDQRIGPKPRTYRVDAEAGGPVTGSSVSFVVPPGAIVDAAGRPATGPITISMREFQSVGDMVRGRRPTQDKPSGRPTGVRQSRLLASSGSFEFEAVDAAGQRVEIREVGQLAFRKWQAARDVDMELWVAGADDDWEQPAPVSVPAVIVDNSYFFDAAPFGNIGGTHAVNCDALAYLASDHVTLKVKLEPHFVPSGGVFFLPTGSPTAAKLYTKDAALPGFVSYVNMMPVGVTGKLIVVSLVDGHYYLYHDDAYTIPAGSPGTTGVNEETVLVTPTELSEADFMAYMAGL